MGLGEIPFPKTVSVFLGEQMLPYKKTDNLGREESLPKPHTLYISPCVAYGHTSIIILFVFCDNDLE